MTNVDQLLYLIYTVLTHTYIMCDYSINVCVHVHACVCVCTRVCARLCGVCVYVCVILVRVPIIKHVYMCSRVYIFVCMRVTTVLSETHKNSLCHEYT